MKWVLMCALALCMRVAAVAQSDPTLRTQYDRYNALFDTQSYPEIRAMILGIRVEPGRSRDQKYLSTVVEGRILRVSGDAFAAYAVIDSLPVLPNSADPLLLYAISSERGRIFKALGLYPKAVEEAVRAYHLAQAFGFGEEEVKSLVLLAEIDRHQGSYDESLRKLIQAENSLHANGLDRNLCNILIDRGNVFYDQERWSMAREQYERALDCGSANGYSALVKNAILNIGSVTYYLSDATAAYAYFDSALTQKDIRADRTFEADVMSNIAIIANGEGDVHRALRAGYRAVEIRTELHDSVGLAESLLSLSGTYLGAGNADSALMLARASYELLVGSGSAQKLSEAVYRLYEVYDLQGNCAMAKEYLERSSVVKARLDSVKQGETIHRLEIAYESEKKEQALVLAREEERTKRAQRNWLIGLSAVLVLLAVVLFRNYSGQKRMRAQEQVIHDREVNDLLKRQEINSLDAMMKGQEQERQRVGKDLHDRIGSMLSAVKLQFSALEGRMEQMELQQREQYQHVFDLLDETVTEVRRISHDMVRGTLSQFGLVKALEDLRSAVHVPGKLSVSMSVFGMEERLDQDMEIAIYRMVQECVSNVMKHARAKELSVQLTRTTAALNIIVEDDGTGFDPLASSEGMGMGNIRERATAYNGAVNVDSRPGHGTTVSIDLPLMRPPDIG